MFGEKKFGILIFMALILVVGILGGCKPGVQKEQVPAQPGRVVAIVNGEEITEQELAQRMLPGQPREAILNQMIDEILIFQAATKEGIKVDERELAQGVERVREPLPGKGISPETIRDKTPEELKHQVEIKLVSDKLYGKDIKISEEEMKAYFEASKDKLAQPMRVRVCQIVVDTRAKAKKILRQLRAGADFVTLAKAHSKNPNIKEGGGEVEFVLDDRLDPEFCRALSALKQGEISEIITKSAPKKGFEIFKVVEKKPGKKVVYEEAKEEIRESIFKEKLVGIKERLLLDLRKEAKIEIKIPGAQVPEPK